MSHSTRSLIDSYELDLETRELASTRPGMSRYPKNPLRYRKGPRRGSLGIAARGTKRSTYRAEQVARRAVA